MGTPEIERFLTHLAVNGNVAASTQNQAMSAILFLYKDVLGIELPWLKNVKGQKKTGETACCFFQKRSRFSYIKTGRDSRNQGSEIPS